MLCVNQSLLALIMALSLRLLPNRLPPILGAVTAFWARNRKSLLGLRLSVLAAWAMITPGPPTKIVFALRPVFNLGTHLATAPSSSGDSSVSDDHRPPLSMTNGPHPAFTHRFKSSGDYFTYSTGLHPPLPSSYRGAVPGD